MIIQDRIKSKSILTPKEWDDATQALLKTLTAEEWEAICQEMETAFRAGYFEAGALKAIERLDSLMSAHFPQVGANPNEIDNAVKVR